MINDPSWLDRDAAWWVKVDRAHEHLRSLRSQVDYFRESDPYSVTTEPADSAGRVAYRLRIHRQPPAAISATVGDVLHNLRSALDSLAYEVARRSVGRPLTPAEERECAFPVSETPDRFDRFFDNNSIRLAVYGPAGSQARTALRVAQPFAIPEASTQAGVPASYQDAYKWDELNRLTILNNIDKHRRLAVLAWWGPAITYWMSNGPSNRRWIPGNGTSTDGSIIGYMVGSDPDVGDEVVHEFNLVLADDKVYDLNDPACNVKDVVDTLEAWHGHIANWTFAKVFGAM